MKQSIRALPFTVGAPSMVYGENMVGNVRRLASLLPHIEILLFHQPDINNIPTPGELREIQAIGNGEGVSFSVHLPASLEIASPDQSTRSQSLELARQCCMKTADLNPLNYIIHVPFYPPTLVVEPGQYVKTKKADLWQEWSCLAMESLELLSWERGCSGSLLLENINFSPALLEPLWSKKLCGFCLDIGHLVLGREDVDAILRQYLPVTSEIHLHGVQGNDEHLGLAVYPSEKISNWLSIMEEEFQGVVNLEVFSQEDLEESLTVLFESVGSVDR